MITLTTFTGQEVNPLELTTEDIDIRDIAHALALCNRFAGHTPWPISVAQHSVGVSLLCSPYSKRMSLQGLLHDAAEAYLGDMTKWLKESPGMTAYREAEDRALAVIMNAFHLPEELVDSVKWADRLMVRHEFEYSFGRGQVVEKYGCLTAGERETLKKCIDARYWQPQMSWQSAEAAFMARFMDLTQ